MISPKQLTPDELQRTTSNQEGHETIFLAAQVPEGALQKCVAVNADLESPINY